MGIFSPPTGTPEEQQQQKDANNQAANQKQTDSINKSKTQMKQQGDSIYSFGQKLASTIPAASGGLSIDEFEAWASDFENGFVQFTPDTTDTPYGLPTTQRPKVRILSKGTDYETQ